MVTGRSVGLFFHLLGVVTLFVAIGVVQLGRARIRAASTVEELQQWLGLVRTARPMFPVAFGLILLSGLFMAGTMWNFKAPWIVVALVSVPIMGGLGGGVVGQGIVAIGRAAEGSRGPIPPELRRVIDRPATWIAATALPGMATGVIWLMVAKPGWVQSTAVIATLGLAGAAAGVALVRRSPSRPGPASSAASAVR
jgi:hypothetical protein